eukprot:CAMPEP_0194026742 /NCGR_PEP_ID=MMETSP0009_2-20130614/1028_1 /TAXON_ID=210454 /ORGANISM="Grammatophora oceanica, Strain CCMP 410" /LENGTH=1050 /DNA_ID=CAMNT_0038665585 /DNA_START=215 /DNA_END=3367 /DNA_ORIENTATION=+
MRRRRIASGGSGVVSSIRPLLLFIALFAGQLTTTAGQDDTLTVGPFVDTDSCYAAMLDADVDGDRALSGDEYVTMVQDLGPPGFMDDVTGFDDMPLALQGTFNSLACMCSGVDCCVGDNAQLSTVGAAPGDNATDSQTSFLFSVCMQTEISIEFVLGSPAPSFSPTSSPSAAPTETPEEPSAEPTVTPDAPTVSPTGSPAPSTQVPTAAPTLQPTTTAFPSVSPTSTIPPTGPPSAAPSSPTVVPVMALYDIIISPTAAPESYVPGLIAAMDQLAPEVADETFPLQSVRSRRNRRLVVSIALPTQIVGIIPDNCPDGISAGDRVCRGVTQSVSMVLTTEDSQTSSAAYKDALQRAIAEGRLNTLLVELNPSTPVEVIDNNTPIAPTPPAASPPSPTPVTSSSGLSAGAISGIAIGAAAIVIIGGLLLMRRKGEDKEAEDTSYFPGTSTQALQQDQVDRDIASAAALGATAANYGKKGDKSMFSSDSENPPDALAVNESNDSSSNAGSSGWSSSAGVSSLNTGSVDSVGDVPPGTSLAAMAAAGAAAGSRDRVPDLPEVTRGDLDTAIEAGDWAAVGATAALLAAASDSQSFSSRSRASASRGGSSLSSMDAARAAELDHLVDAGDWEGVVLAAAKFEASEDAGSSKHSGSGTGGSATGSSAYSKGSTGDNSRSTSLSESPSKAQKRDEIREEVEALVRRVVPEEIDNVDEMMLQFKGREEELVETLRTMQERQVAQKARLQGQKQAKRDARRQVQQGSGLPAASAAVPSTDDGGINPGAAAGIAIGAAAAAGVAAGVAAAGKKDSGSSSGASTESGVPVVMSGDLLAGSDTDSLGNTKSDTASEGTGKRKRTALELAIEAGDWEAVGEAAAMMSDASLTSASSAEIDALAAGDGASTSDTSSSRARRAARSGVNAGRAAELDDMIDKGDWTGVVAAASRFNAGEGTSGTPDSNVGSSGGTDDTISTEERERQQQLKEEEDALRQAEVWMAIAEQSKQEGETDAGASDAADWAIARSLSALRSAEAKGDLQGSSQDVGDGSNDSDSQDRSV